MMNLGGDLVSRVNRMIVCVPEPAISDDKGAPSRNVASYTTTDRPPTPQYQHSDIATKCPCRNGLIVTNNRKC